MASFSWNFDAPTGTYKNHKMSEKLRHAAIVDTKFMQFVRPEPGYGKKMGESITITRVSNLTEPADGRISEQNRIPEDELTLTTTAITVVEWGRSVPYTSLSEDLGKFNINNIIQRELRKQMTLVLDRAAADAFTSSDVKVKFIPDGIASGVFDTDGVASTQATVNLNVFHVEQIRDFMFSDLAIPHWSGDDYVALVSTKAKRGLMSDPAWEQWFRYTDPSNKFNSEIGRLENIRFVEIANQNALSKSLGLGGVLGEGVFFGEDAVVMVSAEDPELRAAIPQDFGRARAVAWYGIMEFGVVWDTANSGEARIVHLTSS